jgi:hypothetical protein
MASYSFDVKGAVEVVEAKLGKFLTRAIVILLALAVVVWTSEYIWHAALRPLAASLTSLARGTNLNVSVTFGDVIAWILAVIVFILAARLVRRILGLIEALSSVVDQHGDIQSEAIKTVKRHVDVTDRITERVLEIESRVAKLEQRAA